MAPASCSRTSPTCCDTPSMAARSVRGCSAREVGRWQLWATGGGGGGGGGARQGPSRGKCKLPGGECALPVGVTLPALTVLGPEGC